MPMQPVEPRRHRVGADGAHDHQVLLARAQLAGDDLDPEEQRGEGGDGAEGAEGERFGPDGLLGLRLDLRRDLEVGEVTLGRIPSPLHGGDVGRAASQLHAQIDEGLCRSANDRARAGVPTM